MDSGGGVGVGDSWVISVLRFTLLFTLLEMVEIAFLSLFALSDV